MQYDLAGIDGLLDAWIIPVNEEFIAFIAPLSLHVHTKRGQWQASFTQEKLACLMEVSVTEQILPPPTHKNLRTRLILG